MSEKPKRTRTMSPIALEKLAEARKAAIQARKKKKEALAPVVEEAEAQPVVEKPEPQPEPEPIVEKPEPEPEPEPVVEKPEPEPIVEKAQPVEKKIDMNRYKHYVDTDSESDGDEMILVKKKTIRKLKKRTAKSSPPPSNTVSRSPQIHDKIDESSSIMLKRKLYNERIASLMKETYG